MLEGRPQLRIVARLAAILEDEINHAAAKDHFWHDAARKLGKLRRLSLCDISAIEALLSKRVPKPVPVVPQPQQPSPPPPAA